MKPTIVLVHGAFAESASWDAVDRPADGCRPSRDRRGQPAAGPGSRRRERRRPRPHGRRACPARRPLLRRRGDLERPGGRRRDHRARLRERVRARPRRELLRAGVPLPRQHARERHAATGAAERRHDRPVHPPGPLPRAVLPGRAGPGGRADGGDTAAGDAGGARRTVRRAAVCGASCRRGSSSARRTESSLPSSSASWRSGPALAARSRSRARPMRSPSRSPRRRST